MSSPQRPIPQIPALQLRQMLSPSAHRSPRPAPPRCGKPLGGRRFDQFCRKSMRYLGPTPPEDRVCRSHVRRSIRLDLPLIRYRFRLKSAKGFRHRSYAMSRYCQPRAPDRTNSFGRWRPAFRSQAVALAHPPRSRWTPPQTGHHRSNLSGLARHFPHPLAAMPAQQLQACW